MKTMLLIIGLATASIPGALSQRDLEGRVLALEQRVATLERVHEAPTGASATPAASEILTVQLTRKEAKLENSMLDYLNLIFDVEFTGTDLLGQRRIRDIKGTLYFDDAFGDEIIGANTTQRLDIAAGESTTITGLLIDYTTVEFSKGWKRVLTTDMEELNLRFEIDKVIYADDE